MNILIVGGAGYLGGVVTDILLETEHEVRVYDFLLYEETYRKPVNFIYGDVRDYNRLKEHLSWADVVVWLAALVGDPACNLNSELTLAVNRDSVKFLSEKFKGRIVFISTCSVYGAAEETLTEESGLNPLSLYAKSKLWAEETLSDSNAVIFRLGTLFGVGDRFSRVRFDLVVNTLVMRAVMHKHISVFGGEQYRPLLHVSDAAEAIKKAVLQKKTGVYNLHSVNTTIIELADKIKSFFSDLAINKSSAMFQDNRNYRVSSEKAKRDLIFDPSVSIDDGILEIKELLEEERIKNSFLNRFSNYFYLRPLLTDYSSPLGKVENANF